MSSVTIPSGLLNIIYNVKMVLLASQFDSNPCVALHPSALPGTLPGTQQERTLLLGNGHRWTYKLTLTPFKIDAYSESKAPAYRSPTGSSNVTTLGRQTKNSVQ